MHDQNPLTMGIDHVGLAVSDLEGSRRFFVERLGWHVVGANPAYPAIFVSDGCIRLTLWQVDTSNDYVPFNRRKNVGLHHLALKVADTAALERIHEQALTWPEVEIEFAPQQVGNGPRVHCMMYEPSGIRVEFVCTRSPDDPRA
ncbi:MAG: VOC family protein [Rudaea sp.]